VQMEDQSKLTHPIQILLKSIWHTEVSFIQGGRNPKNVVPSHHVSGMPII